MSTHQCIVCVRCRYPPGHGDVYYSMAACGLLGELLHEAKDFMFISNVDNLGATVRACV